jgi:hypothetical protein
MKKIIKEIKSKRLINLKKTPIVRVIFNCKSILLIFLFGMVGCTKFNNESKENQLVAAYRMHFKKIVSQHRVLAWYSERHDSLVNLAIEPYKETLNKIDSIFEQKRRRYGLQKELYTINIYDDRVEIKDFKSENQEVWSCVTSDNCNSPFGSRCITLMQFRDTATLILYGDIDSIDVIQEFQAVRYFP